MRSSLAEIHGRLALSLQFEHRRFGQLLAENQPILAENLPIFTEILRPNLRENSLTK